LTFVTVDRALRADVPGQRFKAVPDANRWNKIKLLWVALRVALIVAWERPHVVISTGAAPGLVAVRFGKLLGARTVWVDSIANAEEMSMSGRLAVGHAGMCLTQWPHLARPGGPRFEGTVL
jgi:hypothetical protein